MHIMTDFYKVMKSQQVDDQVYEVILQSASEKTITLALHEELVIKYRLVLGKEVDLEVMQAIYDQLDYGKAYQEALKILTRQAYSASEVKKKLEARKFEAPVIREVLKKLEEVGLLNDEKYTSSYIQHHVLIGKKGPNMLKQELLNKGIAKEIIDYQLATYKEEAQVEHVTKIANQQLNRLNKKYGPHLLKPKIYQYLISKGFNSDIIKKVLDQVELETEVENPILINQIRKLLNKYESLEDYEKKRKITQSLMRKGFNYDEIGRVYDQVQEEI